MSDQLIRGECSRVYICIHIYIQRGASAAVSLVREEDSPTVLPRNGCFQAESSSKRRFIFFFLFNSSVAIESVVSVD